MIQMFFGGVTADFIYKQSKNKIYAKRLHFQFMTLWKPVFLYAQIKSSNFYFDSMVDLCYLSGSSNGKFN